MELTGISIATLVILHNWRGDMYLRQQYINTQTFKAPHPPPTPGPAELQYFKIRFRKKMVFLMTK